MVTGGKPASIRLFHVLLILSFFLAYFLADDNTLRAHAIFGSAVLVLVLARLLLGLAKEEDHSLRSLNLSVANLKDYAMNYFAYNDVDNRNPASSWAMLAILILGLLVPVSGIITLYIPDIKGVHGFLGEAFLIVAIAHMAGVLSDKVFHGTTLIEEMSIRKSEKNSSFFVGLILVLLIGGIVVGSVVDTATYEKWREERKALRQK